LDGSRGWIHSVNVQGTRIQADHIAIEQRGPITRIYAWNDDRDDWPPGYAHGHIIDVRSLQRSPLFGMAYNTAHTHRRFAEDTIAATIEAHTGVRPRPFSSMPRPPQALVRHGIWMPDALHRAHEKAQDLHGWREWTEGVDRSLIHNGRVADQRRRGLYVVPDGTRTYYHNAVSQTIDALTADFENELGTSPAGATTQNVSTIDATGQLAWAAATAANEPDTGVWPTSPGTYRAQLDVVLADVDMSYGLLTQGAGAGAFYKFYSTLATVRDSKPQDEAAFTLSGLKLATVTPGSSWLGTASSHRYGYAIAAVRTGGHGNKQMTLELGESDDFTDGPWPAAPTGGQNAVFHAHNF
jgi:hypothetical protein